MENIEKMIQNDESLIKLTKYPHGAEIEGEVVAIKDYGIFIEFGLDDVGFIHISELDSAGVNLGDLDLGDIARAKVKRFNVEHQRYDLVALEE
jgi:predicted RNA-binding protein with RPS1 domain